MHDMHTEVRPCLRPSILFAWQAEPAHRAEPR